MTIPWDAVVWAGFVATVLASSILALMRVWKATDFSPAVQLGCLFIRDPRTPAAEVLGLVLLFLLGSTLVPALYFVGMSEWAEPSWRTGALLGSVHGVLAVLLFPLLGTISACVRSGHLPAPGWLGLRWGWPTPLGIFAAHLVYGALVGAILAAF